MSKILTDELIEARLLKINVLEREDLDHDYMLKTIANHFDFKITSDWVNTPDYMFYTETTADGYEVWIATDNDRNPNVNEDIYYYDSDWLEKMPDAMTDGCSIYYDQLDDEEYAFQEVIEEVYDEYYNDKKKEIENELIEEGYEYEREDDPVGA
tara:strand:- start:992 stop:1453 length:462 start_codon:yes stop_codon:yes gene_type:complete